MTLLEKIVIAFIALSIIGAIIDVATKDLPVQPTRDEAKYLNVNKPLAEVINKKDEEVFKKEFINSCVEESENRSYCECGYEGIMEEYTMKEMLDIINEADISGEYPDRFIEIAFDCL